MSVGNSIVEIAAELVVVATIRRRSVARRTAKKEIRRLVAKAVQRKQFEDTEQKMTKSLTPFFARQIRSAQKELDELKSAELTEKQSDEDIACKELKRITPPNVKLLKLADRFPAPQEWYDEEGTKQSDAAVNLAKMIFNPREWDRELVDRSLPVVAEAMIEGAVSTLAMVGVELRKSASNGRKLKRYNIPVDSPVGRVVAAGGRFGGVKVSTASEWLEQEGIGPPPGVSVEYPQWLQKEISNGLRETFEQDYWTQPPGSINDTTLQDLEMYIDKGLRDGWSISKMAANMTSIMGPEYSKARATNVARTESGNALNAGRDASIRGVQEAVGPEAAPQIGKGWLSVLGNTTRDTHADADGQLADADGNFNLAGYIIPWPSHVSLPPGERCNCQCTITMELGVGMPEAELQAALGELEEKPVDPGSVVESSYGPPVTRQLESHAKEIRDLEKERLFILNRDGTAFDRADGTRDTITLTEEQERGLAGRITMHNHPNQGMPFSPTDVTNAIANGELESHVVGPNGVKYKMDFSSLVDKSKEDRIKMAKRVKRDFSKMNREESEKLIPLMRSGEIKPFSRDSAARGIHNTWTRIAEKHGLGYSGEPGLWQR